MPVCGSAISRKITAGFEIVWRKRQKYFWGVLRVGIKAKEKRKTFCCARGQLNYFTISTKVSRQASKLDFNLRDWKFRLSEAFYLYWFIVRRCRRQCRRWWWWWQLFESRLRMAFFAWLEKIFLMSLYLMKSSLMEICMRRFLKKILHFSGNKTADFTFDWNS